MNCNTTHYRANSSSVPGDPSSEPPPEQSEPETEPASATTPARPPGPAVAFTRAGALWSALFAGFLILILLLVFILQNTDSTRINFFAWQWNLPVGVAILLAAVCGGLLTVLAGTARIVQLRRTVKKNLKAAGL